MSQSHPNLSEKSSSIPPDSPFHSGKIARKYSEVQKRGWMTEIRDDRLKQVLWTQTCERLGIKREMYFGLLSKIREEIRGEFLLDTNQVVMDYLELQRLLCGKAFAEMQGCEDSKLKLAWFNALTALNREKVEVLQSVGIVPKFELEQPLFEEENPIMRLIEKEREEYRKFVKENEAKQGSTEESGEDG